MIKCDLSQGYKDSSVNTNQSMWYTILTHWRLKLYDHLNGCKKSFRQNSTPIYDKNSSESGHRGNLSQYDKGNIRQTHSKYYSQWWKTESISSGIRNKTRMSNLTTIIQHSFESPRHVNQRRKRKWLKLEKKLNWLHMTQYCI